MLAAARPPSSFQPFEAVASTPLRVKRGHSLFHAGDAFAAIYAVRFGSFKTFAGDHEGRQQVVGFALPGDVLGLEGIASGRQHLSAVALEDSEVLSLPFASVERAARDDFTLQRHLHGLMSAQMVHHHGVMMLLGSLGAGERVAAFLLHLSRRYQRLGRCRSDFVLRMTRADIGSYLGLKIETISRTLTQLAQEGLIEVHDKHIRLVDLDGLERAWSGHSDRAESHGSAMRSLRQLMRGTGG